MRPGFDVVVPVYDGADVLGETLRRLAAFGGPGERFILVDDASGDARTVALLAQAAADPRFTVHRQAANGGFVAAANAGLALATRDVVLLNADAWVTAGWLDRLHECRASAPAIGCACPLSNHATLLTIAEAAAAGLDPDAIAAAVARASAREYVRLPTAHGFCMLLTREAIDRVGVLDEAFGRGYGEENDWSLRAIRAGFEIACADGAYVHHVGEASFGRSARTERLRRRNAALLSARWPGYRAGMRGWLRDNPLRETIERATSEIRRAAGMPGRRLLVVTWKFGHPGGIEEHLRQALPALAKAFDTTVLCLDRLHGAWADAIERRDASGARIVQWGVEGLSVTRAISGVPAGLSDARAERFVRAMLAAGGYDLVHFHSLAGWNSLALPAIAREAGCRTVFTVHDFHLLCPEGNLVDPSDRPCGKARACARDEGCLACLAPRDRAAPGSPSLAGLLLEREVAAARALEAFDRIIAPSRFAAGRLARAFPELAPRITVIPHGVEAGRLPPPPRSSELRVAFLGRFSRRKGAAVVLEAAAMLRDEMIEFAVFGPLEPGLAAPAPGARIRFHGPYRREDLPVLLRDADLVLVPSVVEESFGLVFSEAQALGIPVVASPLGALAERLVDGENGFAFPAGDAGALATLLRRLCRAMHRVEDVRARLRQATVTPVAESAAMTLAAYDEVLAGAVPAPRWIAAAPRAPVADMATWLRLDAGPSAGPWMRAKAMPPLVTMRIVVRVAAGCGPLLARTLASLGDFAPVTVLGEGERPGPVAEETVLALEAGDEVDLSVLAGATRWLREHPGCELVAFDEARITRSGERYGVLRRAGVNRGALECGAALGRVLARTRAIEPGGDLPFDGATLALALLARKGRAAVAHRAELLAHRIDVPAPPEPADAPSRPVPAFAVVIRVEERRPPIASALQFWRHPAWGPSPVVVLLEAEAPQATLLSGALAGGATAVDLAGASGAKARLDRVLSSLAEDFALVQSDRVAWLDAEAPRALLRAAAGPDVAIATALLASDGERVIHAGYTLGAGGAGLFGNVLEGWNVSEPPPAPFDTPVYDVAAASRLALAVRRAAWRDGQPEGECNLEFAIVEQGLALTQAGGRVVACTEARAVLLPPAGIPVDTPTTPAMRTAFLRRWSARIADDPFHSPRLSLDPPWREESRFGPWRGDPQVAARVVVLPPVPDSPEASRVRESLASLAAAGRAAVMVPSEASRPVTIAQVVRLVPRVVVMQEPFDEARLATWRDLAALGFARRVLLADARPGDWNARSVLKRAASLATRVVVADRGLGQDLHGRCPDIRVLPGFAPDPGAWAQAILD